MKIINLFVWQRKLQNRGTFRLMLKRLVPYCTGTREPLPSPRGLSKRFQIDLKEGSLH